MSSIAVQHASLYATSNEDDAITIFVRDPTTGRLAPVGFHTSGIDDLYGVHDRQLIVTPDGGTVLVANGHGASQPGLLFLDRDPVTGLLAYHDELVGSPIIAAVHNVTTSPNGDTLYAALNSTAVLALRAPTVTCDLTPRPGCRASTSGRARLVLRDPVDLRDTLKWEWRGGGTAVAAFGNPVSDAADVAFCLYVDDASRMGALARGGAQCKGRPCWKLAGAQGLAYTDRTLSPSGVSRLKLKVLATGEAKLLLAGKGAALPAFGLPFGPATVRAQLVSSTGECWDSTFSPPHDETNPGRFSELSD